MRKLIIIIMLSLGLNLTAQTQNQEIPIEFIGNWYNPKTNEWSYGFFEKFAIINGKPFFYDKIKASKSGIKLTFTDKKIKPLVVKGDSTQLQIGKIKYNKVDKFLPNYTGTDTTSFYDSKFQKVDTAYIAGYLRNNKSKEPFGLEVNNWIFDERKRFYGDVDENGFFQVKVPLCNTTQSYIDWRRSHLLTVLTPGEHYFVFKDLASGETIVYGDNSRFHNEILKYNDYTSRNSINPKTAEHWRKRSDYEKSLKDTSFLQLKLRKLDTLQKIDSRFIASYNLSSKSRYYIDNYNKFQIASNLMQKRFDLDRNKGEKFSNQYMQVIEEKFYKSNITPLSLVLENGTFLTDYVQYKMTENSPINIVYHAEILNQLIDEGKIVCDDSVKEYSKLIPYFGKENVDSLILKRLQPLLNDSLLRVEYEKVMADNADLIGRYVDFQLHIKRGVEFYKSNLSTELSDLYLTRNILKRLHYQPQALIDDLLSEAIEPIESEFYKSLVKNKNLELVELAKGKLEYADNLKNTDHLKEAKDADKIIAEILAPHKGKVVYMDFWGTWCGPCVAEMEYAPNAKKAMEDKDMVFVYMANGTPKSAWENFIKAKNLEGENVFHYNLPQEQQAMIERRLGVKSFPTYLLFNRKGEMVNDKAPRPSMLDTLVREVDKLLE